MPYIGPLHFNKMDMEATQTEMETVSMPYIGPLHFYR